MTYIPHLQSMDKIKIESLDFVGIQSISSSIVNSNPLRTQIGNHFTIPLTKKTWFIDIEENEAVEKMSKIKFLSFWKLLQSSLCLRNQ